MLAAELRQRTRHSINWSIAVKELPHGSFAARDGQPAIPSKQLDGALFYSIYISIHSFEASLSIYDLFLQEPDL